MNWPAVLGLLFDVLTLVLSFCLAAVAWKRRGRWVLFLHGQDCRRLYRFVTVGAIAMCAGTLEWILIRCGVGSLEYTDWHDVFWSGLDLFWILLLIGLLRSHVDPWGVDEYGSSDAYAVTDVKNGKNASATDSWPEED